MYVCMYVCIYIYNCIIWDHMSIYIYLYMHSLPDPRPMPCRTRPEGKMAGGCRQDELKNLWTCGTIGIGWMHMRTCHGSTVPKNVLWFCPCLSSDCLLVRCHAVVCWYEFLLRLVCFCRAQYPSCVMWCQLHFFWAKWWNQPYVSSLLHHFGGWNTLW